MNAAPPPASLAPDALAPEPVPPRLSIPRLFVKFLGFGANAWGGPAPQIAMLRHELVDRERWISPLRFNRALAVYQVLPGPEAHELCCYMGYVSRGRLGAIAAGLGFMLPGFALMMLAAWAYARFGAAGALTLAIFAAVKPAVAALIVRATQRIGDHVLGADPWLVALAIGAFISSMAHAPFAPTLAASGLGAVAALARRRWLALLCLIAMLAFAVLAPVPSADALLGAPADTSTLSRAGQADPLALLGAGLRAGMLTFGGAYTVIPFLRDDAVIAHAWLTDAQFLDGIAIAGVLPAPLVIFGTFIGFIAGGPLGALAVTAGIFAPAFAFTLIGHRFFERLIAHRPSHRFLDGVSAGVVGLIAATAVRVTIASLTGVFTIAIFAASFALLALWKHKAATPAAVLLAAGAGVAAWAL